MFEHIDEQPEKRELMRVLARAVIKIDEGEIGGATDDRAGEARIAILKVLEMLKGKTPGTPAMVSAELRRVCESLGVRGFSNPMTTAQYELATAESLLTGLRRIK